MLKVVITGPESSGKTTLARALAKHYKTRWVPEYARDYLSRLNRPYKEKDLVSMALGQVQWEEEIASQANNVLICDTALLVFKVWANYKFGRLNPTIESLLSNYSCDLYILPHFDIPYEEDVLRENPNDREKLFEIYRSELNSVSTPYVVVDGSTQERLDAAIAEIDVLTSPDT